MIMVFGLLLLILVRGFGTFWPHPVFETTYTLPGASPSRSSASCAAPRR
jgi:phosphate transport system permease protein